MKFRWETEFKETEIGEIPRDWEVGKLGNFVDIIRGVSFSKEHTHFEQFNNCIALLRANNIAKDGSLRLEDLMYIPKEIVKEEQFIRELDIIMVASSGNKDLVGKFAQIKEIPFTGGLTFGAFNFCIRSQRIEKLFLKFLLSSEIIENQLEEVVDGTNINNLRINDLKNFKIPFPPLPEQARIATVLSWFDDLIEVKKKQNEILEKTAMAIFKNWFIDFEPFKDEEFVYNEELGKEIPKGWEVKRLGDVVEFFDHKRIPLSQIERLKRQGIYPYYGANGIIDYVDDFLFDGKFLLVPEDGIIADKDGYTISFLVNEKFWANNHIHVLKGKLTETEFLYLFLKLTPIEPYITGAVQPKLSQGNMSKIPILLPPPPILQSFHSLVEPLFQKIILNQKQIMTLRKVRDTLLPLLVFGKLRVEEM